jgi:A/G-specific adenine glycosylase
VTLPSFASRVIRWQSKHGRHDLPWQGARDAYRIWISEVMLQQTQVTTVIPFYERFIARYPDVASLAAADSDQVLGLWSGLGYYARARNLHAAARKVVAGSGAFPHSFDALVELPGIGRSSAGAIAAFSSGERRAILDGNVRRVLARHAGIAGSPADAGVSARLWALAESRLPRKGIEGYTQGLMDLGATLCMTRAPACERCPVAHDCVARIEERWHELPGKRRAPTGVRRSLAMLVVIDRGEVLLEKRAASGIWGGLWSLPEASDSKTVPHIAREVWGLAPSRIKPLDPFEHAFTHFTLEVHPCRVYATKPAQMPPNALWLPLSELDGAALPSPVKKLLRRVASAASGSDAAPQGAASHRSARGASASRRS